MLYHQQLVCDKLCAMLMCVQYSMSCNVSAGSNMKVLAADALLSRNPYRLLLSFLSILRLLFPPLSLPLLVLFLLFLPLSLPQILSFCSITFSVSYSWTMRSCMELSSRVQVSITTQSAHSHLREQLLQTLMRGTVLACSASSLAYLACVSVACSECEELMPWNLWHASSHASCCLTVRLFTSAD